MTSKGRFALGLLLLAVCFATAGGAEALPSARTLEGHSGKVYSVAIFPDGTLLASGSADNTVRLWNVTTGAEVRRLAGHTNSVYSVAFSPDGTLLASGSADNTVKLWNVMTGAQLHILSGHTGTVCSVAFSPDGKLLASGSADRAITLWDVARRAEVRTLAGHTSAVCSVAFSPDGKLLASGSDDSKVKLWDVATSLTVSSGEEEAVLTLAGHTGYVRSVAFSPDGKLLASGSEDDTVKVWDVSALTAATHSVSETGAGSSSQPGQSSSTGPTTPAPTSTPETQLGQGSSTGSTTPPPASTPETGAGTSQAESGQGMGSTTPACITVSHAESVYSSSFSPDGRLLASGSYDGTVKLSDAATGALVHTLVQASTVWSVAFSPDGKLLASGLRDGEVKLWNVATGTEVRTLTGHTDIVWSVVFSPDGKFLASGSEDKTVKLWDIATGAVVRTLVAHSEAATCVAFSPDGTLLASGMWEEVELWNAATGEEVRTLVGHVYYVNSVAFSPDGRLLASGSSDSTIKLWDVATGAVVRTLAGHTGRVWSVAFSPDGKLLASGADDMTVKLWDVATGEEVLSLQGHTGYVSSVAFSPDGRFLASGSWDKTVKLCDVSALTTPTHSVPETGAGSSSQPGQGSTTTPKPSSSGEIQPVSPCPEGPPGEGGVIQLSPTRLYTTPDAGLRIVPSPEGYVTVAPVAGEAGAQRQYTCLLPVDLPPVACGEGIALDSLRICFRSHTALDEIQSIEIGYLSDAGSFQRVAEIVGKQSSLTWQCLTFPLNGLSAPRPILIRLHLGLAGGPDGDFSIVSFALGYRVVDWSSVATASWRLEGSPAGFSCAKALFGVHSYGDWVGDFTEYCDGWGVGTACPLMGAALRNNCSQVIYVRDIRITEIDDQQNEVREVPPLGSTSGSVDPMSVEMWWWANVCDMETGIYRITFHTDVGDFIEVFTIDNDKRP